MGPQRIGVLGGTFDPPHVGHLVAAAEARHQLGLDVVLLVVANEPWQKTGRREITPAEHRLAMVTAAVDGAEGLEACDLELVRGGPSYTADTLAELAHRHPGCELHLVLGADAAAGLRTWVRWEEIRDRARLVVVERPGSPPPDLPNGWDRVDVQVPGIHLSSTDLRARAAAGRPLRFLVPEGVERLIAEHRLYRV